MTLRERDLKVDVITPCHVAQRQPSCPTGALDNYQSTMWVGPLQEVGVPRECGDDVIDDSASGRG